MESSILRGFCSFLSRCLSPVSGGEEFSEATLSEYSRLRGVSRYDSPLFFHGASSASNENINTDRLNNRVCTSEIQKKRGYRIICNPLNLLLGETGIEQAT